MVWVKNKTIYLYEGDTGKINVELIGDIQETDRIEFRIKEELDDEKCLYIQEDLDITDGKFIIDISKSASALLKNDTDEDKTYYYGFKLYRDGDAIDTMLAIGKIIIKKGV